MSNENLEIFPKPFEFPKNLASMSDIEKENLLKDFIIHSEPYNKAAELNPSKVISPDSPEYKAHQFLKKNKKYSFDEPMGGYVVNEEDPATIEGLSLPEEVKANLLKKKPRLLTDEEFERLKDDMVAKMEMERISKLGPVQREIEERFGDI